MRRGRPHAPLKFVYQQVHVIDFHHGDVRTAQAPVGNTFEAFPGGGGFELHWSLTRHDGEYGDKVCGGLEGA